MELNNLIKSSNIADIEKYLIENPETINKTYPGVYYKYQTPLLCAVEFSNIETVKLLLDYGANTNMSVHKRCFPLYKCRNSGKLKLLLDYGANPNLEDDYNKIAIFHTMFYGAIPILLEYDSHCNSGSTKTAILAEKIRLLNTKN